MECENTAPLSPDEAGRGARGRKRNSELICGQRKSDLLCPVCGVTIGANGIENHFTVELQRLEKSSLICGNSRTKKEKPPETPEATSSTSTTPPAANSKSAESAWSTYQKIKTNRQARLKTKSRKRKTIENICPVCNRLTSEEIHAHVEKCLNRLEKRQRQLEARNGTGDGFEEEETISDEDEEDDDDGNSIDIVGESSTTGGGETYEEYEWAGQTRIRASSLLPGGGFSGTGMGSSSTANNDNDEDLNVDGDDTTIYGPSQFTEKDVIPAQTEEADNYLRSLIAGDSPSKATQQQQQQQNPQQIAVAVEEEKKQNNIPSENEDEDSNSPPLSIQGQIIESLKARLREYEQQSQAAKKIKCQICLEEEYKSPVVSISCWHVHCEQCWLQSLGARKLCPKCNMITRTSDLRRIFL